MIRGIIFSISGMLSISLIGFVFADDPLQSSLALSGGADASIEIEDAQFGDEQVEAKRKTVGSVIEITLRHATVVAGGGVYWLDVSKNKAAEQTLIKNSELTHGDARQHLVTVKGKLQFRKIGKEVRPVILVDSLKVRLGFPGVKSFTD